MSGGFDSENEMANSGSVAQVELQHVPGALRHSASHVIQWQAYAQLVRFPNVFTALADIAVGTLAVRALTSVQPAWYTTVCLFLASACLYSAGMVWNDYFDVDQDRRE